MSQITLLDGGLGQEIYNRARKTEPHSLWSVMIMQNEPEVVIEVHKEFIAAGARVISLNNYTATPTRLGRFDMGALFETVHSQAVDCVNLAIDSSDISRQDIDIAGCLPPLSASYVAAAAHGYERSFDEYCAVIEQQKDHVDLFLIETISNITEARAAVDAVKHYGFAPHIGLTVEDDATNRLRSGEPLADALSALTEAGAATLMVNCSYPEAVTEALPALQRTGLRFGGYANGFTSIEALAPGTSVEGLTARTDLGPEAYGAYVQSWIDAGATVVGGCCEIGPDHIRHMNKLITQSGNTPVKLSQLA